MVRDRPHPDALFYLVALNDQARVVVSHAANDHLASRQENGDIGLDVGHAFSSSGDSNVLATIGRNGDILVPPEFRRISKIQCSFEIHPATKVIMYYDKSHSQTSQVASISTANTVVPFLHGRPRKVVVMDGVNGHIGMGGSRANLVKFALRWHCSLEETLARTERTSTNLLNPRLARTEDFADTEMPSRRETRIHAAGPQTQSIRYKEFVELGSGQFGRVFKGVDLDTGNYIAIKKLTAPSAETGRARFYSMLKREVEILARVTHEHIIDLLGFEGADGPYPVIFMGLKQGNLEELVRHNTSPEKFADKVLHQMLQALDHLARLDVVHRDVKPANILYVRLQDGAYSFVLGDFGLGNECSQANTQAGSPNYMAPELFFEGLGPQTPKLDVWSLYVTMLWTLNLRGFRQFCDSGTSSPHDVQNGVAQIVRSEHGPIAQLREMARDQPEMRASAAQMLVKVYGGRGLSTPLHQVPPIPVEQVPPAPFQQLPQIPDVSMGV